MPPALKIAPSLLSCDFARIGEEMARVEKAGADLHHVDVMDGHFVPNLTIGPPLVQAMRRHATIPLDCHLMMTAPHEFVEAFAEAGADIITIHVEADTDVERCLERIRRCGVKCGLVLNPGTPLDPARDYLNDIDMLLVMSVWPGFGGQSFIADVLPKISEVRSLAPELDIEIDGGINHDTGAQAVRAGANVLVAGSYVFKAADLSEPINRLRALSELLPA